ncbi:MAG: ribosome maturation factor RimP [Oscillospiraceae bacterium]|nr:ribosome maturation factor RimP [Oscillospiraceae bacterium]
MSKITQAVWTLAQPVVEKHGCELWDVEYVTEAGSRYLRVYIDKPDGVVGIDDCEAVSRELDVLLDETDPIPDSYVFEVSSAGAERELKRPSDFERFLGSNVEVRFFKSIDGRKSVIGELTGYENGDVTIRVGENTKTYLKAQIAQVRLRIV